MAFVGRGMRLLALLNSALEECVEENRLLELQLSHCHGLLGPWKYPSSEEVQQNISGTSELDPKSSAEEQKELAVLNRALEKAMRIRSTISAPQRSVHEKAKFVPEMKSSSVSTAFRCPTPTLKEKDPKTAIGIASARTSTTNKHHGYKLHPPYRTNLERKRNHEVSVVNQVKTDQHQTEGLCLHTKDCLLNKKVVDQMLGVSDVDVFGHTHQGSSDNNQMLSGTTGNSKKQTITFKEMGNTLKLPLTYRQSAARNERLWEKVLFWQSKLPADSEIQFIKKMESAFDTGISGFSPAAVGDQLTVLTNAHAILREYVDRECCLESTRAPTFEEEYHKLLLLESLHDTVSQHISRLEALREAANSSVTMHSESLAGSMTGLATWRYLNMSSLSRPLLVYSSAHELKGMAAQKLRIRRLQQQLHIQKVLMAELLPLLESKKLSEPTLAVPFRAIYTQLCEGGQRFPALVFDDLPD